MEPETVPTESFHEFKNSFSYGSRTDLNFKFLAGLSEEDGAKFFQDLLWKLGDAFDDGKFERIIDHVADWQYHGYSGGTEWSYDDGPFTPLKKPISEAKVALLTSSGHFVKGDDPEPFGVKQMTQEEAIDRIGDFLKAEPTLSVIPAATSNDDLCVRHGGYDIRGAQADPNVVFPLERLRESEREGEIGKLAETYSFVGACAQMRLLKRSGPQWASKLQEQHVDVVLLVPVWPVCHVSVGHVARVLETAGIATVVIAAAAFKERLHPLTLPRVLLTPHVMGRPIGPPGNAQRQRETLMAAFQLLQETKQVGTITFLSGTYKPGK